SGFDEPSDGDPMGVEANRNGDGDESDRHREVKKIQHLGCTSRTRPRLYLAAEKNVDRGQSKGKPRHVSLVDFIDHGVGLQKINSRIDERQRGGNRSKQSRLALRLESQQRGDRENRKEQRGEE